ncbi:putative non-ribosomal peptide synthetase [Gordonia effusa NBRC 100432]|uniref:Putative non-ribosomal peptide synthetase n=1 Tax=Gordonia effusa NBRC 100432 TaxID=1077974 RepID=H0QXQ4_9ACTN|nr:non-ribosomal peptide synthetase [Gordonia effusa]GAB17605.1 putative non-ribosomal peptide synthetase [Gordonia effusa NBRC 100432]
MRTLDDLQRAMAARLAAEGLATAPAVSRRRDRHRAPLSFGQRYVWAHQQINPGSTAYNLCLALTFRGSVDDDALRRSFEALVARHEVLRTTYHTDEGGAPFQQIHDDLPPRVGTVDLTGSTAAEATAQIDQLVADAAHEEFDLTAESSMRLQFVRVSDDTLVVILVIQHIAWDGMTLPALSRDVERAYAQAISGEVRVEPLELQVADFAEAEQDAFEAADHSGEIDFWASRFIGESGAAELADLPLPYDRRPVVETERGERLDRLLGPAADKNLRDLANRLQATPFQVFLAAYYLALREITGQSDIVVGTTVANREEAGTDLLIGNLSNMLPLRFTGAGASTFAELTAHTAAVTTEAFAHKMFPQEAIVRAVNRVTGNVGSGLFDTMVLFLQQTIDGPQLPGVQTSWELAHHGASLLPIAVEVFLLDDRVDVQITYRTDLFNESTITRLHDYIDQMLSAAAPEKLVTDLLVLSEHDRERLNESAHGPLVPIEPETLDAMIRASASRYPDRVAVVFGRTELTYAEFDARVNSVARLLINRGVVPGDKVGLFAERSEWLPIVFSAILRVGAVYVPIDPSYPADRVEYMVNDAELRLIVCASATVLSVAGQWDIIDVWNGAAATELASLSSSPLADNEISRPVHPLDTAYLLYTSGTTGRPKGVMVGHRAAANHVQWMAEHFAFGMERILQKAPVGFDVSVFELINALCTGSATVLPPADWWQADVESLTGIIAEHQVTQISLVPSVVRALLDSGPDPALLASMRYVYLGGEAVPPELVSEASDVFGGTVLGLYGPTEAAMDIMHEDFTDSIRTRERYGECVEPALIGVPESNSSVYVLDDHLRPVPPGVVGELYLAGVQLAHGYHRRPDLSATAFVACPFADQGGARMYRTGDIARWNGQGSMEYLGRADDQVKVRGHRIELGEISSVLRQAPGIAAAAVAVHAEALVGYYVPAAGADDVDDAAIRDHLSARLPDYMVPTALLALDALPLTANGKLDRKALPVPELGAESGNGRELRGDAERAVAAAIGKVLGLADPAALRAGDDFLALGGDSISAIRIAAELKKVGWQITTSALFAARSVAGIAAATGIVTVDQAPALVDVDGPSGWVPLNPIATMWTEQNVDRTGFALATAVVTPPDADGPRVRAAVESVIARHPMLRASLVEDSAGRLAFHIPADTSSDTIEFIDVTVESDEWNATAGEVLNDQLKVQAARLDPDVGRTVAAIWVHTDDARVGRLLLVIHHLVVDGVSWRIITENLREAWESPLAQQIDETSMRSWSTNVARLASDPAITQSLADWDRIAATPDPVLGTRAFDPLTDTVDTVAEVTAEIAAGDTEYLMTAVATAFGAGFLDVQLAALTVAVNRFRAGKGQATGRVAVTMERHGRAESLFAGAQLANTVGWFTTAYPAALGADGAGVVDVESSLALVKEQSIAVRDSGIAWGLLRWLNPETRRTLESHTAPQISFNYMGRFAKAGAGEPDPWDAAPEFGYLGGHANPTAPAPALLDVNTVTIVDGAAAQLRASFRFPVGAIAEAEVRTLVEYWRDALADLVKAVRADDRRRLTPSDVLAAGVDLDDLSRWRQATGEFTDVYPLAPMQAGLFYTALSAGAGDVYNTQTLIKISGQLDIERLGAAFATVVNRYPNLRVRVAVSKTGVPHALVSDHVDVPLRLIDISDTADVDARLEQFNADDNAERFDLASGPLTRVSVLKLPEPSHHLVVLTMHHILLDGWSGQLLMREVFAEYASAGAPPIADPATYGKFLALTQERAEETEKAWAETMNGVGACLVAPDRGTGDGSAPLARTFTLDDELVAILTDIAGAAGATFSTICQVAWANTLRLITGEPSTVFGEAVSGRPADLDGVDTAIGCFTNIVPAVITIDDHASWRSLLGESHTRRTELMEYPQYPLTSAMRTASANGTIRKLFDTMFVYESYPPGRDEIAALLADAGLRLETFEGGGATDNSLLLMIFPANSLLPSDSVEAIILAAADAFEPDEADIVEAAFLNTLRQIAAHPDQIVTDSAVLDDDAEGTLVMRRMWQ